VDHNMAPKPWISFPNIKAMVLGIGWNFSEILSDMCTHNFEAWKFQNGCRCHKKTWTI
jgi:hypothetical protein